MASASARTGPVLILSRSRARAQTLAGLLSADRYRALVAPGPAELASLIAAEAPTVLVLDWARDDEPDRRELIARVRALAGAPRLVVVAAADEAAELAAWPSVRAVVGPALDVDEVADAVWRAHHEALGARARS